MNIRDYDEKGKYIEKISKLLDRYIDSNNLSMYAVRRQYLLPINYRNNSLNINPNDPINMITYRVLDEDTLFNVYLKSNPYTNSIQNIAINYRIEFERQYAEYFFIKHILEHIINSERIPTSDEMIGMNKLYKKYKE